MYIFKAALHINKIVLVIFIFCCLILGQQQCQAQLCTGSLGDPVVNINFGAGTATHAGALATGTTSYTYSSADFPTDGSYTVENSTAGAGNVWWSTTDHTGNTGGYMMVVNASVSKTDYFYKSTVSGLCPGTTYEFAAWVVNLLRSRDISPPNITFTISTTGGTVLGTYTTGSIPLNSSGPVWTQYGLYFTTPANVSDVVIQMTNNSSGGAPANDLALDDITFRACGPVMVSSFSSSAALTSLSSCSGAAQTFTLTSAVSTGYTSPVYKWQINNGTGWVDIRGATGTTYTATQPTVAGTYQYRLVSSEAVNAGSVACLVASNLLTLSVTDGPTSAFSMSSTNCSSDAVVFTDQSTTGSLAITKWLWDFGDGQTAAVQNPTHIYIAAGDYPVKLTVTNSSGCASTSATQTVHISAKPVAAFSFSSPVCAGEPVTLTDQSTSTDGAITKWVWNYSDGTTAETRLNNTPFTHTYSTSGNYTVTLQAISLSGCSSDVVAHIINIHSLSVVDFSLPDICLSDADAQFTDKTTIDDNTQSGFIYLWDFGDPNATAGNPNTSTVQNSKHKYSQASNYTVSLTVTSASGCTAAKVSKIFTVNGAVPQAGFTVENSNNLCSGDAIVFDNTSSVDFGNITKIEFYYDYNNSPNDATVYYRNQGQIPSDNKFYHTYRTFSSPLTKNYEVKMIVYSGETCSSAYEKTITVNANPNVTLSSITSLCQEASPVQITENKNGFNGTGVFSGTGISATGLFDPVKSGAGPFTISYLFTASSGCTYSTSQQVTVYATPVLTMPAAITMLEGGQVTINAQASGDGLVYKWIPSAGLNNPAVLNPVASPTTDTQYQLTVTSANGCTAAGQVYVYVLKTPVVPNTFTPNGDGINDTWEIKYLDSYPNCTVDIFNRYGTKLFASMGYPKAWDGTYRGSSLPAGVYYYVINPKNGRSAMSGSLTILR
ncbi:MAG: type sorting protein [Mucilaginibacter sp.]|nr:type sorting protein [Mucilaginibacter sp.]